MEGLMTFTGLVMIAFGILQIILFFKLWGMTNNVKRIWDKINNEGHLSKACVSFIKGDIEETEKLLNDAFLQEVANLSEATKDYEVWNVGFSKVEERYKKAFSKIDRQAPDFDKYRDPKIYLL